MGDRSCAEVTLDHTGPPFVRISHIAHSLGDCVEVTEQMQMSPRISDKEKPSSA